MGENTCSLTPSEEEHCTNRVMVSYNACGVGWKGTSFYAANCYDDKFIMKNPRYQDVEIGTSYGHVKKYNL